MNIVWIELAALTPNWRNARTHSKKQIRQIADSIKACGFAFPIVTDERRKIIAGHGRYAAAQTLGLDQVPVITVDGLSPAKKRALALADNKIAENAGWDREILSVELPELAELLVADGIDISITGFASAEIDQIAVDFDPEVDEPVDGIEPDWLKQPPISRPGDLWQLGGHRLLCGDAREADTLKRLIDGEKAAMAFLDPPYNVRVRDIVGRGRVQYGEFAMASGEMSQGEFVTFLTNALGAAAAVSSDGALHYICMDWRHIGELLDSGHAIYDELLNIIVWVNNNGGQGSFYRSQHEFIAVFRVGEASHTNNIELGRHGRNRTNVWHYAGANTFRPGRMDDLQAHPTVKPTALVADAIKDCTKRNDIVLDTFSGSGTTILAAERVGRRCFALEIEPRFVDVAIRRWQAFTRKDALCIVSGRSFDEMVGERPNAAAQEPTATDGGRA
jgi:DNA modification methylase